MSQCDNGMLHSAEKKTIIQYNIPCEAQKSTGILDNFYDRIQNAFVRNGHAPSKIIKIA